MNPGAHGRPPYNQYNRMAEPAMGGMAGGAAGAAAGYGAYHASQGGAQAPYGAGGQGYGAGGGQGGYGYNNGGYPGGHDAAFTSTPSAYDNIPSDQLWAMDRGKERVPTYEEPTSTKGKKKPWIIAGICILVAAIIAVVVAVVVTQTRKSNGGSSKASGNSTEGTELKDPNDPSNFDKDDRLHKVFWGMAYQPDGAIPPMCGATQANVTRDIQILSQLTTRLRLYGANCNMTALVLQAIQDTKVEMTIYPAICAFCSSCLS